MSKPRDLRLLAWWAGSRSPLDLHDLGATLEAARSHCKMSQERFAALLAEFLPWLTAHVSKRLERRRNGLPASPRVQPAWLTHHRWRIAPRKAKAKKAAPDFNSWMHQRLVESREIEDDGLRMAVLNGLWARIVSRALPHAFDADPEMAAWLAFDMGQLRIKDRRRLIREADEEIHQRAA